MNARQLAKVLLLLVPSFGICYGLLFLSGGSLASAFEEFLSAFLVVATLLSALSIAFFTHLDNIAKDLTDLRNDVSRPAYENAHERLTILKKEVVFNGALIAALFVMERAIKGIAVYLVANLSVDHGQIAQYLAISLRFSFFVTSIWAAASQVKGFLTSIDFRSIIAKGRK